MRAEHRERALEAFDGLRAAAVDRAVRELQQAADERRVARDHLRELAPRRVAVVDGAHELGQQQRPARRVLRIARDRLQRVRHGHRNLDVLGRNVRLERRRQRELVEQMHGRRAAQAALDVTGRRGQRALLARIVSGARIGGGLPRRAPQQRQHDERERAHDDDEEQNADHSIDHM